MEKIERGREGGRERGRGREGAREGGTKRERVIIQDTAQTSHGHQTKTQLHNIKVGSIDADPERLVGDLESGLKLRSLQNPLS